MSRHLLATSIVVAVAALFAAGCGSSGNGSSSATTTSVPKVTAKSINSPFIFTVAGSDVTVAVSGNQAAPAADLPAQVVCANLATKGFTDRNEASLTWKKGATSATVTLPKAAAGMDLCAISFTSIKKLAVAVFSAAAKKKFLAGQTTAK